MRQHDNAFIDKHVSPMLSDFGTVVRCIFKDDTFRNQQNISLYFELHRSFEIYINVYI